MDTRREFLLGVAVTTAALSMPESVSAAPGAEPWPLLDPAGPGSRLGLGWSTLTLDPLREGARRLHLQHDDGRRAEVLVCRRDGHSRGVAATTELDFVVVRHGPGTVRTDEDLARALTVLATAVRERESRELPAELRRLMSHDERERRFGSGPRDVL
jgi:hypothetical protein